MVIGRCYAPTDPNDMAKWLTRHAMEDWELVSGGTEFIFKRETFPIHEDADF